MTKKFNLLFLVFALIFCMTGCGGKVEEILEDEPEEDLTEIETIYLNLDGYYNLIAYEIEYDDTTEAGEANSIGFEGVAGDTIEEALKRSGYSNIKPVEDVDTFEGWMKYSVTYDVDDDGIEETKYTKVSDALLTTEAMLKEIVSDEVVYIAKWASIPAEDYFAEEDYMVTDESYCIVLVAKDATMRFKDFAGEEYDTAEFTYWMETGESINTIVENQVEGYAELLSIKMEGKSFASWTVYECDSVTWGPEESTEEHETSIATGYADPDFAYVILANASTHSEAMTTEELKALPCAGKCYYAVANWK